MNKKAIYIIILLAVILVSGYIYDKNKKEEFRLITDETEMTEFVMNHSQEELDEYRRKVDELKANDPYGGETPEETLDLYIEALEAGDMELASKYFRLEDQDKELEELNALSSEDVGKYIELLNRSHIDGCNDTFGWCDLLVNVDGVDGLMMRVVNIEQSELWKLRSL